MRGDDENYSTELTKVKELIAKEISIIDQVNSDSNETLNNSNSSQTQQETQTDNHNRPTGTGNDTICRYYLKKSCNHGKKGDGCNFTHPKLCFNFIKRGDKRGGCKKGANCQFTHPNLCRSALERRVCVNKRCSFYHVTGTKFMNEETVLSRNSSERPAPTSILQRPAQRPYRDALLKDQQYSTANTQQSPTYNRPPEIDNRYSDNGSDFNSRDFLELKQQMKTMMDQMQMLMTIIKPQTAQIHPSPPMMGWGPRQ